MCVCAVNLCLYGMHIGGGIRGLRELPLGHSDSNNERALGPWGRSL